MPRMTAPLSLTGLAVSGLLFGYAFATPAPERGKGGDDEGGVAAGADVIVGAIPNVSKYGSVTVGGRTWMAYAFGTTSCNIGNAPLEWFPQPDPRHPFIPMNAYRYKDGRFEQIGMGWGKHGFYALQQTLCGPCQSSGTGNYLGVGCSDPYSSSLNGSQSGLGTRTEVNAATGVFPGTFNVGMPSAPATIGRRVQIDANDLDPALNAGAQYVSEGQYIHAQDAAAGNDDNNASWRAFTVGSLSSGAYTLNLTGPTVQQKPAIEAWKQFDPEVQITMVDVPGDGRFLVGSRATEGPDGLWRYEYAIQNLNSHRSARSVAVPVDAAAAVSAIGFRDIDYHSGDAYDPTDWATGRESDAVTWTGGNFATNPNGNALRFATLYNFRFTCDRPPTESTLELGLFRPSPTGPGSMSVAVVGPSVPAGNPADLDGDGRIAATDLAILLAQWGGAGSGDLDGSGNIDAADLAALLAAWTG